MNSSRTFQKRVKNDSRNIKKAANEREMKKEE